jgi:hypothetical protein
VKQAHSCLCCFSQQQELRQDVAALQPRGKGPGKSERISSHKRLLQTHKIRSVCAHISRCFLTHFGHKNTSTDPLKKNSLLKLKVHGKSVLEIRKYDSDVRVYCNILAPLCASIPALVNNNNLLRIKLRNPTLLGIIFACFYKRKKVSPFRLPLQNETGIPMTGIMECRFVLNVLKFLSLFGQQVRLVLSHRFVPAQWDGSSKMAVFF